MYIELLPEGMRSATEKIFRLNSRQKIRCRMLIDIMGDSKCAWALSGPEE